MGITPAQKLQTHGVTVADRFRAARGGRKTATAVARIYAKKIGVLVNGEPHTRYFRSSVKNQRKVAAPLELLSVKDTLGASVRVAGGGVTGQAEAARNAIAKALAAHNPKFKPALKAAGFITRDARAVERKKYGLKKARRAPQWSKR